MVPNVVKPTAESCEIWFDVLGRLLDVLGALLAYECSSCCSLCLGGKLMYVYNRIDIHT